VFKEEIRNIQEKITIPSFIDAVRKWGSLDQALINLNSKYIEFYLKNETSLKKAIKALNEDSSESPGYVGQSRTEDDVVKIIKYKGQLLRLQFDADTRHWLAIPAFRSIVQALRYGKDQIDEI